MPTGHRYPGTLLKRALVVTEDKASLHVNPGEWVHHLCQTLCDPLCRESSQGHLHIVLDYHVKLLNSPFRARTW